jgi:hypothetical protein
MLNEIIGKGTVKFRKKVRWRDEDREREKSGYQGL